jgi:hypothetical protein
MVELLGDPKQRNPEWRESNRNCFCNRNILTTKKKTQNKHSPQPYTTKNKPTQPYCTKQSASSNNLRIFWRSKHKFIIAKNPTCVSVFSRENLKFSCQVFCNLELRSE